MKEKDWKYQLREYYKRKNQKNIKRENLFYLMPNKLDYKRKDVSELKVKPHFIGFDTETYASNGNMICLCNSDNDAVIYGTPKEQPTIKEYYNYFHNLKRGKGLVIFGAWNLKFDASIILKSLPEEQLRKFYEKAELSDKYEYWFKEYNIHVKYIPKKCLTMSYQTSKKGKKSAIVNLFDFMQFYSSSLDKASSDSYYMKRLEKLGIVENKHYDGKYQDKVFPDNLFQDSKETQLVVDYCILDCKLAAGLMQIWVDDFFENFGFYPDKYYSAGYLTKTYLSTQFEEFYDFLDVPFPVQELAYNAYLGGRFEIMARGYFQNIYHYDINSAYPYSMCLLPDLLNGKWIRVTSEKDFEKYGMHMGFAWIDVNVEEKNISPFLMRDAYGRVFAPRGRYKTCITHHEYYAAKGRYDFMINKLHGYCFIPADDSNFSNLPLNRLIADMYNTRLEMKGKSEGQAFIYKVLINSVYGKFAQAKPHPTGFFNPVVCAFITGKCRGMLIEAAANHKEEVIMFATDSIFSTKPIPEIEETTGEKVLGEWEKQIHPRFRLVMAGVYDYTTEKNPNKFNTQNRGFTLKVFDEDGKQRTFDFGTYDLSYNKKDDTFQYKFLNRRPIAISQALIQHKFQAKEIGKMTMVKKTIDINGDRKRLWFNRLTNLSETNYSWTQRV